MSAREATCPPQGAGEVRRQAPPPVGTQAPALTLPVGARAQAAPLPAGRPLAGDGHTGAAAAVDRLRHLLRRQMDAVQRSDWEALAGLWDEVTATLADARRETAARAALADLMHLQLRFEALLRHRVAAAQARRQSAAASAAYTRAAVSGRP